jgi:septal ring factor EnvC (AmiA/AmiB activator)
MDSATRIKNITEKINRLAQLLERLRNENQDLVREIAQVKEQLANQIEKNIVLEKDLDHKQADCEAQKKQHAEQSGKLKKQFDLYIEEIDRCIEWLQNE